MGQLNSEEMATTYAELRQKQQGVTGYAACDLLVNLRDERTGQAKPADQAQRELIDRVNGILLDLSSERFNRRGVMTFYIGKTYIIERAQGQRFDHMNPQTWTFEGIRGRWTDHEREGDTGLIVIAAVPPSAVPQNMMPRGARVFDHYTVALEQMLLHHFMIFEPTQRHEGPQIRNDTFATGAMGDRDQHTAGALYISYRLTANPRPQR